MSGCKCNTVLDHTQGEFLFYVTGRLEESGVIFASTAFDEDVAETLIIFINNINSFYNSLDQCDQNFRLRIFCILCQGEQPFFCLFHRYFRTMNFGLQLVYDFFPILFSPLICHIYGNQLRVVIVYYLPIYA